MQHESETLPAAHTAHCFGRLEALHCEYFGRVGTADEKSLALLPSSPSAHWICHFRLRRRRGCSTAWHAPTESARQTGSAKLQEVLHFTPDIKKQEYSYLCYGAIYSYLE